MKSLYFFFLLIILSGCAYQNTNAAIASMNNISDEQKTFISNSTTKYGSRSAASSAFLDKGFKAYNNNEIAKAEDYFNKAKLLDDRNPEVYHGLGSIPYDQGDNCRAMETMNKALHLDWSKREYNRPSFLADLGMVTSLCAYTTGYDQYGTQDTLIKASDNLFLESQSIHESAYLYDKWWQALYWRGDFSEAWEKVFEMRRLGGEPNTQYLQLLKQQMPNPNKPDTP